MIGSEFDGGGDAKPGALPSFKLAHSDDPAKAAILFVLILDARAAKAAVDDANSICLRFLCTKQSASDSVKTLSSKFSSRSSVLLSPSKTRGKKGALRFVLRLIIGWFRRENEGVFVVVRAASCIILIFRGKVKRVFFCGKTSIYFFSLSLLDLIKRTSRFRARAFEGDDVSQSAASIS